MRRGSSIMDLRRESLDRRASLAASRRSSVDQRIPTVQVTPPRKKSIEDKSSGRRRSSGSVLGMRNQSPDRRSSQASRKSSVVSIGEYGYLAAEIEVTTTNTQHAIPPVPSLPPPSSSKMGKRRGAPTSIRLPPAGMATIKDASESKTTPTNTARFNPLDTFLGRSPPLGETTPKANPRNMGSLLDRPRPISPPEFLNYHPFPKAVQPKSPKDGWSVTPSASYSAIAHSSPTSTQVTRTPVQSIFKIGGVTRKAVPPVDVVHEAPEIRTEIYRQQSARRGSMERFIDEGVDPLEMPPSDSASGLKRSASLTDPAAKAMAGKKGGGAGGRPAAERFLSFNFDVRQYRSPPGPPAAPMTPQSGKSGSEKSGSPFARLFKR